MHDQNLFDLIDDGWFGDDVLHTHSHACVNKPVVNDELDVGQDVTAGLRTQIFPSDMDQTSR